MVLNGFVIAQKVDMSKSEFNYTEFGSIRYFQGRKYQWRFIIMKYKNRYDSIENHYKINGAKEEHYVRVWK